MLKEIPPNSQIFYASISLKMFFSKKIVRNLKLQASLSNMRDPYCRFLTTEEPIKLFEFDGWTAQKHLTYNDKDYVNLRNIFSKATNEFTLITLEKNFPI